MVYRYIFVLLFAVLAACSKPASNAVDNATPGRNNASTQPTVATQEAKPTQTPSNKLTAADIAKLKWLQGTWKSVDDGKPFYERYRFEGTTMIVEAFDDDRLSKATDTTRFELKNGEFGHTEGDDRSAASEITDDYVQFVPATGKSNSFRFERQADGTWHARLEWIGPDNAPRTKTYIMEPLKK